MDFSNININKKYYLFCILPLLLLIIAVISCQNNSQSSLSQPSVHPKENLEFARKQIHQALTNSYDPSFGYPRSVENDSINWVPAGDWTSGFSRVNCGLCINTRVINIGRKKPKNGPPDLKASNTIPPHTISDL